MSYVPTDNIKFSSLKVQHATMQQGLLIVGDDQGSLFALGANGEIEWQTGSPDGAGKVVCIFILISNDKFETYLHLCHFWLKV